MVQKKPEYYGDYSSTTVSLLPDAVSTENLVFDQSTNDPLQIIPNKELACKISFKITKNEIKNISTNIKGNENSVGQPIPVIDKRTCPNVTSKEVHEVGIQCSLITSNKITDDSRTNIIINDPNSTLFLPKRTLVTELLLMITLLFSLILFCLYMLSIENKK